MYSTETLDAITSGVFNFGAITIALLTLYFQPFWFRQLIHCYQYQEKRRTLWLAFILLTNLLGAFWYWRLTPLLPQDPEAFDKAVDSWLKERKLSLDASKNRLVEGGEVGAVIVILLWIPFIIFWIIGRWIIDIDEVKVPHLGKYIIIFLITTLVIMMIKKMIKLYQDDRFVSPWMVIPILQAKRGNKKEEMFFFGDKQAPHDPLQSSIETLFKADFFTLFALFFGFFNTLNILTLFQGFDFLFSVFMFSFGLLFIFISVRSNATVIFYNHPEFVFFVLKHYKILSIITYFIPIVVTLGALMMITEAIIRLPS